MRLTAIKPFASGSGSRWFFLFGALLFVCVIAWLGWEDVATAWRSARPLPLMAMVGLVAAGYWLRAWKWRYALGAGSGAVPLFFAAKVAANWSPGRLGEFAPLLLKRHRTVRVAAWLLADRVLEAGLTLWCGLLGLSVLGLVPAWQVYVASGFSLGAAVLGGVWLYRAAPETMLAGWAGREGWRGRAQGFAVALHGELRALGGRAVGILVLTALAKLTDLYIVVAMCAAFGYGAPVLVAAAARCAHALVTASPVTPDASGVPYAAQAWMLHTYAEVPYAALTAGLVLEAAAINGVLYLFFAMTAWRLRTDNGGAPGKGERPREPEPPR